jgi:hypothetical protein
MALFGGVAEWLGGGLQNLKRRFESVLTPQYIIVGCTLV